MLKALQWQSEICTKTGDDAGLNTCTEVFEGLIQEYSTESDSMSTFNPDISHVTVAKSLVTPRFAPGCSAFAVCIKSEGSMHNR